MWWWYTSSFRWPDLNLSVPWSTFRWPELSLSVPWSIFRWPALDLSYWNVEGVIQWNLSLVDDVVWALITGLESIALLALLCYFFICCGCTL
ncbi:uncharacterized protein LOC106775581 [Vigna radiata var. radiata]|uniref:Uncharacterized protein LOC106775581 n=1 Tax=Vigna radiata var. radiata TaxID=3916 RepID=A0A1S3VIM2_VIGRR|nr:uncharacterized protein LOC106775581 [Vigna radiata var. radiata]